MLHNLIFLGTAYDLLGFSNIDGNLHAAVRQLYITSDAPVNLADISAFLLSNGFVNTRRQDYFNAEYGLILEDMHVIAGTALGGTFGSLGDRASSMFPLGSSLPTNEKIVSSAGQGLFNFWGGYTASTFQKSLNTRNKQDD